MRNVFFAIVALQMLFLLGQVARYQGRLSGGETVYLKVVPYDPRSLFMGNYASLRFDVSQVPVGLFPANERGQVDRGDTIYVGLTKDRPARMARASLGKPADAGGLVWLKGQVIWVDQSGANRGPLNESAANVEYGLERYYLSEPKGKRMDELNRQLRNPKDSPKIIATVSVADSGVAMLKGLSVNGKPVK